MQLPTLVNTILMDTITYTSKKRIIKSFYNIFYCKKLKQSLNGQVKEFKVLFTNQIVGH